MTSREGFTEDALDLLEAFETHHVRYVVVGAHAMAVHGVPRATGDLDVLVDPTPENARTVVAALLAFGAPLSAHGVGAADFTAPDAVYQLGLPPRRIDLLTGISGVTFAEAWGTRVHVDVGSLRVPFLARDVLIKNKRAAGRAKDLADLEVLVRQRGK
jgi:hypothetical protein